MPLLCPRDDWRSPGIPHAMGTGHMQPGQGPVEVSPLNRLPLYDPGTQHRFCDHHVPTGELHTATCLRCLQVDLWDKSVKLSFCPFCTYVGGGGRERSFIPKPHHNSALQQQLWMRKVLKAGLRVIFCSAQPQEGVPWVRGGGDANQGSGSTRATPKKKDSKAPASNSQGSSTPMALQTTLCPSGHDKPHKDSEVQKGLVR